MENQANESWTEMLKDSSRKDMNMILWLQYMLYALFSQWFLFVFYFIIIFGISFYFLEYKNVSSVMFAKATIIHFVIFFFSETFFNYKNDREEIWREIEEIRALIKNKKK